MVTTYHMLECSGMDLLHFPAFPAQPSNGYKDDRLQHLGINDDTWCLFSIEVRNSYGSPFDVTLFRLDDGKEATFSTATIPPGAVSRCAIALLG